MKSRILPLLTVTLLFAGCGAIANKINALIHDAIEQVGTETMGVPVLLDSANVSLSTGVGELNGLTIANPEGYTDPYAFSLQQIRLNIDVSSISGSPKRLDEFILDSPAVFIEVLEDDRVNLKEIADRMQEKINAAQSEQASTTGEPDSSAEKDPAEIRLAITDLKVTGVKLTVRHRKLTDGVKEMILPEIHLKNVGGTEGVTGAEISLEIIKAVTKEGLGSAMKEEAQKGATKFLDSLKKSQEGAEGPEGASAEGESGGLKDAGNSLLNRFK